MISKMPDVDPEQILKELELELARRKPMYPQGNRNAFRIWSLALLVFGLFAALWMLQYLLDQMPKPDKGTQPAMQLAKHTEAR